MKINSDGFRFREKYLSQIPALQLLINLGFEYLSPSKALAIRSGKADNVVLEGILRDQLKRINRIRYKGGELLFSEENIQTAISKLKSVKYDSLIKTNEAVYDLLTLGTSLEQTIEGDSRSFNLNYIDWHVFVNNVFHVTAEYDAGYSRSLEQVRPDIVLFVNGIPLAVIECTSPNVGIEQAVSQSIQNQSDDFIPKLFTFVQLVMGVNKNRALYATVGFSAKFWGSWKELQDKERDVAPFVRRSLTEKQKEELFSGEFAMARPFFDAREAEEKRLVTEQDKALYSLCRPERLLELAFKFTVFDSGIRKMAHYQQYFSVKSALERVQRFDRRGRRKGGIIWQTQGSGKLLTMIMLARCLALDPRIRNPRLVLVTDRLDLDKQLKNTFAVCGLEPNRATSGKNLLELVAEKKPGIVTTLIHKFDKALNHRKVQDDSVDTFMLIDESHRTNFGCFSARMRQIFPYACYLGFTGTPLMKKEKNRFVKFGGLIKPHYSTRQALEDKAVVPLLYESRRVEMARNKGAIDLWFEHHGQGLTPGRKADLKEKYGRAETLNKADQILYRRAFDISEHFRTCWQGTGFKAQLVAPSKADALKYQEYLNEIGSVTSEVLLARPDVPEGYGERNAEPKAEVVTFWRKMMNRFGREEEYAKQIINQFKVGSGSEILIVVSKLLTGFDAPRNVVIYLCKELKGHAFLQTIARVNRLCENKDYGYVVDYVGLLGELDQDLTAYRALEGFDEEDLRSVLTSVQIEVEKLPQFYSDLWDLFTEVRNRDDEEAYEVLLADDALREEFYRRLADYAKVFAIALSTETFFTGIDDVRLQRFKDDLKRFQNLRTSVKLRYAEGLDRLDDEPRIKKLFDTHIRGLERLPLNEPVNIFDSVMSSKLEEDGGEAGKSMAALADSIAYATRNEIAEKMEEDPAFYENFSKLIQQAIEDFREQRLSDLDYLNRVMAMRQKVVSRQHDDIPEKLSGNEDAMAFYGVLKPLFAEHSLAPEIFDSVAVDTALAVQSILHRRWKVMFWDDVDARNQAKNDIDDYLFDEVKGRMGVDLSPSQMDELIEKTFQVARSRSGK